MRAKARFLRAALAAAVIVAPLAQAQPAAAQSAAPPPMPAVAPPAPAATPSAAPAHEAVAAAMAAPESTLPWPRIEQVRRGNRVVEVNISSSKGEHRYTMVNREGLPPLSTQDLSSGLSTPRFLKFEF